MSKLFICTGAPGSGKSSLAQELSLKLRAFPHFRNVDILSTDNYWLRPDGRYDFNIRLLNQAHDWTFGQFQESVDSHIGIVILDNTNLQFKEFKRYAELAYKNGWTIKVVEPQTDWRYDADELFKRNTHNVPLETIKKMLARRETVGQLQEQVDSLWK